jgi:MtN3 and saliva related transmembrane protein
MFLTLTIGVALWAFYGVLKADYVIILANGVSLGLLFSILAFKLHGSRQDARRT